MDVEPEKVEATLARLKPQLEAQDFELIARLRRLFGLSTSETTREVTGAGIEANRLEAEVAQGATAPGAPLENNICERALKMAICHRRNSLFYRTQHDATVGDTFTSLDRVKQT